MYGIPQERDFQSTAGRRRYLLECVDYVWYSAGAGLPVDGGTPSLHSMAETPSLHCQRRDAVATFTAIPVCHGLVCWQ